MSSSLAAAFQFLINKKFMDARLERKGEFPAIDIQITSTNYSRKLSSSENTISYGSEYLISKKWLDGTDYIEPKRGDRILGGASDMELIGEVEPLYNLGNRQIFGWRVRTE